MKLAGGYNQVSPLARGLLLLKWSGIRRQLLLAVELG